MRRLIDRQFPQWGALPVRAVTPQGWDNRTFRLGGDMLARLPSAEGYASQVEKEQTWLPRLAGALPAKIPEPLAVGQPSADYPWRWSIYRWLEGRTAASSELGSALSLAEDLGAFLRAFHGLDASDGPEPGLHNYYRGGPPSAYSAQIIEAISRLPPGPLAEQASILWASATSSRWEGPPVWVHGDFAGGNLLLHDGRLVAVIDFGCLAVGDPACDLVVAWTLLPSQARAKFRTTLGLDNDTWTRAKGWALWKAIILMTGLVDGAPADKAASERVLHEVLSDP